MTKPVLNGNYVLGSDATNGTLIRNYRNADRKWLYAYMMTIMTAGDRKRFFIEECNYYYDPAVNATRRVYGEGFSLHYVPATPDGFLRAFVSNLDTYTWELTFHKKIL